MGDTAHPGPYLLPPHTSTCTGCGPANSHGLQLVVYRDGDEVYSDVTFDERHIGAPGLALLPEGERYWAWLGVLVLPSFYGRAIIFSYAEPFLTPRPAIGAQQYEKA